MHHKELLIDLEFSFLVLTQNEHYSSYEPGR